MTAHESQSHTLYVQNINDRIKPENLKQSLYLLFSAVGEVIEIHLHLKAKYRGQAWVVFKTARDAGRAKNTLNGATFYGKALKIVDSVNKSDIISKADGTYASLAQKKIDNLQSQLLDSVEGTDGSQNAIKRKFPTENVLDSTNKRPTNALLRKASYELSTEPTAIILATNFPPSVDFDAIMRFFDTPSPLSVSLLTPNNAAPLLQELAITTTQSVYKIDFKDIKDATAAFDKHNRFKFDEQTRLKLAYLLDLDKLMADSANNPNSTVSLDAGGEIDAVTQ